MRDRHAAAAGSINLKGARIDDLVLNRHRETIDEEFAAGPAAVAGRRRGRLFRRVRLVGEGAAMPGADTVWTADGSRWRPARPVTLTLDQRPGPDVPDPLRDRRELYVHGPAERVPTAAPAPIAVAAVSRWSTAPASRRIRDSWTMHTGPIGVFDGAANYDIELRATSTPPARKAAASASTGGWLGFTDKYWLTAIVPDSDARRSTPRSGRPATRRYQAAFTPAAPTVSRRASGDQHRRACSPAPRK